jgi:hypothetical protein
MAGGAARAKEEEMRAGRFFEQKETKETKKNEWDSYGRCHAEEVI